MTEKKLQNWKAATGRDKTQWQAYDAKMTQICVYSFWQKNTVSFFDASMIQGIVPAFTCDFFLIWLLLVAVPIAKLQGKMS